MLLCVSTDSVRSTFSGLISCPLSPAIYVTGIGTLVLLSLFVWVVCDLMNGMIQ